VCVGVCVCVCVCVQLHCLSVSECFNPHLQAQVSFTSALIRIIPSCLIDTTHDSHVSWQEKTFAHRLLSIPHSAYTHLSVKDGLLNDEHLFVSCRLGALTSCWHGSDWLAKMGPWTAK